MGAVAIGLLSRLTAAAQRRLDHAIERPAGPRHELEVAIDEQGAVLGGGHLDAAVASLERFAGVRARLTGGGESDGGVSAVAERLTPEALVQAASTLAEGELEQLVRQLLALRAQRRTAALSSAETDLLQEINCGLSGPRS